MGVGVVWLLSRIRELGSVSAAARAMELSYPKAMRMIKAVEQGLGFPVVVRHKGGSNRGGAELTPEGAGFLDAYSGFQDLVNQVASREFQARFPRADD